MIDWHDAGVEFLGFLAGFLATGAIGFRLAVLNRVLIGAIVSARDLHLWIAAIGVVFASVMPAFFGQWTRTINPMHRLAAGFWTGTPPRSPSDGSPLPRSLILTAILVSLPTPKLPH